MRRTDALCGIANQYLGVVTEASENLLACCQALFSINDELSQIRASRWHRLPIPLRDISNVHVQHDGPPCFCSLTCHKSKQHLSLIAQLLYAALEMKALTFSSIKFSEKSRQ